MIKRLFTLIFFICAFASAGFSQTVTNYSFAASSGTFTNISGATSPALSAGTDDEGYFNSIPLGFDFWYLNTRYTTISVSTNGWLTLGAAITAATPVNNLTSGGTPRPVIAPLWDNLQLAPATKVSYVTTGTAGSRVFTAQCLNLKWTTGASGNTISLQAKLYEGTGRIQFIYQQESGALNSPTASIGISATATGSGNFLSVSNSGTSVSSTVEASVVAKPISGNTYAFTPPAPAAPTGLTFSSITSTDLTLNWSDLSSNETGFVIYKSTDGVTYSFSSQTAANTTLSLQSGLTVSTLYYWKVYALAEGGLSVTPLAGSQSTSCSQPGAPTVSSPLTYCQNASAIPLTASGTGLVWGGLTGAVGGTSALTSGTYVDNSSSNKKTNFTTAVANLKITTVDLYIPAFQTITGVTLSIYNSAGTIIATSATTTTLSAGSSIVKVTSTFNYTLTTAGDYSIGVSGGSGNIGSNTPVFPITEASGTMTVTGASSGGLQCFNNIKFVTSTSGTAPTPSTTTIGSTNYYVSQTFGGCAGQLATIVVNVTAPSITQVPASGLTGNYRFNGNALDASGNNNGTLQNSPTSISDRFGDANSAYSFNGSSQYISTARSYVNPIDFSVSIWFKTSTVTGGKLIGFGGSQTGSSSVYDRHIYMNNTGQIYFGIYPGTWVTINSALPYNDNAWHLATATLSSTTGMALYVDGEQVASNAGATVVEVSTGYWRMGFDNLTSWPSRPTSAYFSGALDDAVIYDRALSALEADVLFRSPDGAGNSGPVCSGSSISLSATTLGGASYAWTGPGGFSSSLQNPTFTYTLATAGLYTVVVTEAGCTVTAYTNVTGTANPGQWTGNISTDWADGGNWCAGVVPTASTNVTITSSATQMPTISTSVACKNLTIGTGAALTTSNTGTLSIAGLLTSTGTMTNNGTTVFNGTTGQQTFSGVTAFNNLSLNNSNGLLLPAPIVINNTLTLSSGILTANNFAVSIGGDWINSGSINAFAPGTAGVTFNGSGVQSIGGTFRTSFYHLTIANTGNTVTLGVNASINGDLNVASGTFNLSTFTANHLTFAGTLTVANNATLRIGGTNTFPTNYATNTLVVASTVEYAGTNQTVGTKTYGNLTLSSSSGAAVKGSPTSPFSIVGNLTLNQGAGTSVSFTAGTAITINGNVVIGASTTFNGSNYIHPIGGSWTNAGTFTGANSTITFTGSGTTVSGSGAQNFHNLTVTAPLVTFSSGSITVLGNLATTGAGSFSQASGGTLTMSGANKTISGSGISIDNLTVSGTTTTSSSLNLTGNLVVSGTLTASAASITLSGTSKTISGAGTKTFGTLSVTGSVTTAVNFSVSVGLSVIGSLTASAGTATFTGSSTLSGIANLFNTTINGTSLQLSGNATLGVANTLIITSGTLNVTSTIPNTVNFNGTGNQNINTIAYNNLTLSNGNTKTAVGALTINNSITIATGTTFNPGAFTHTVFVDWNNAGTFTAGTSTIQFSGSQNTDINGATTFNVLTINNSNAATGIILNSNISAATVNMTLGTLFTGTNTITITTTRTGNGIILGNIHRLHAFTTGVAYAFEGPNNTITFAAVSAVTDITVSVAQVVPTDFTFASSISRFYTISVPAGTYTATLRLHYEDNELNGNAEASMTLWNYNGAIWIPIGKTGNNTTTNYVEQSGLTTITDRWTGSTTPNVAQWNGSVSSNWNTAANWTGVVGASSLPPSSADVAVLGTAAFTNQPTISTAVTVKNIVFGSAQAVTLSMASGGSLVSGDILGSWTANAAHTINTNSLPVTVHGDLSLSDGTTGHTIALNIGAGTVIVDGSVNQSGTASVVFSAAGSLTIGGDYNYVSGIFTGGSGTITYNGSVNQHIGHITYNNLSIDKPSGIGDIDDPISVIGNLLVQSGELDNSSTTTITGNVTIASAGILTNRLILHVGGNWLNNGTYVASGTNIFFDGAGTQTISASTFNNFTINKPVGSTAVLTGNIALKGDFTILSGTFDIKTFDCNRTSPGGTLTLAAPATFIVGANNSPLNFLLGTLDAASTVIADGVNPQFIFGVDFGHLIFRNGGVKTLVAPITIKGDLTIESGATFDGGAETLTLQGNWINNGTYVPSTSTTIQSGVTKTVSGATTFNKVTINGSYTNLSNITYNDFLHITNTGSVSAGTGILTTVNGDLTNNGTLYTLGTGTFTGAVLQTLSLINAVNTFVLTVNFNGTVSPVLNSTSPPQFGYLNINNTGGVNPSVNWAIAFALTVSPGASFNGGTSTHTVLGSLANAGTITSSGTLNFTPAGTIMLAMGSDFSSTGLVNFGGAGAVTLTGTPVILHDVLISNTNVAGITPPSGWSMVNDFTVNTTSVFNPGSYTYSVGGNFLNTGTINSATSTFILDGTDHQDLSTTSAFTNLTIDKATNSVGLFTDATVNGVLDFISGLIETENHVAILSATGSITGAAQTTGWVNGNLQKYIPTGPVSQTFDIGDALSFSPVLIAFSNVSSSGDLTVFTTGSEHPDISNSGLNPKGVNRFWTLVNDGVAFTDYSATLHFVATDVDAGATTADFSVGLYSGTTWELPVTVSPNPTDIQATGMTVTGDLVIGEECNAGTTIDYAASPYCSDAGSATVTLTGISGGTYTSDLSISINAGSGAINLASSTPGSYAVIYSIAAAGGCSSYNTSDNIIITEAPDAVIAYDNTPYCSSSATAPVTLIGSPAGTFSSTTGLTIDGSTGTVDLSASTAGSYTITYSIGAADGCAAYFITTPLTVTTQPSATGTYEGNPYCSDGGIAFPTGSAVGLAGTLTSTAGLIIDPPTGVIDLAASTPGIYTVTYNVPAFGGCAAYSNTSTVSITGAPFATISYAGSPYSNFGTATVTLVGSGAGAYASTAGLAINGITGNVALSVSTPDTYTVTYTIAAAQGCAAFVTTASISIISNPKTWDGGAVTSLWGDAANWDPDGVPVSTDDIYLTGANTIHIDVAAVTRNLILNNSGLILTMDPGFQSTLDVSNSVTITSGTLNGNDQIITIGADWINQGTFNANTSTLAFNGISPQYVRGSSVTIFHNMAVSNTSSPGVRIETSQNLQGTLTLAGNVVFDADGTGNSSVFKLLSTADNPTQDAAVDILPTGAQITGNVTVQRYMSKEGPNNNRIYRYISFPVQSAPVSDFQNEIAVTGSFTGTSVCSDCLTNQSMFSYDESAIIDVNGSGTADLNDGYIDFPTASNAETFSPGKGYAIFVRGNLVSSALWDVRGPVNAGNVSPISLPVTFTSSGNAASDGWNLVGNPFPSTVDWNAASGWTKTNLNAATYTPDNGNASIQFATWNGVTGTNGGSRYIAAGQGFWVKANGSGTPVLETDENTKVSGTQTTFFRESALDDLLRITMIKGLTRDEAVIHFRPDADPGLDNYDAWKLKNGSINISSLSDTEDDLVINSWSPLICRAAIGLNINHPSPGNYDLMFTNLDSFDGRAEFDLYDSFVDDTINVTNNTHYPFSVTADARSYGSDRFMIRIKKPEPSVSIAESGGSLMINYKKNIQWYFNGVIIPEAISSTFVPQLSGTYSVIVTTPECQLSGSIDFIVTDVEQPWPAGLDVYPNPVTDEVFVHAPQGGIESIVIFNVLGQQISKIRVSPATEQQIEEISMKENSSGIYLMKIIIGANTYTKRIVKK